MSFLDGQFPQPYSALDNNFNMAQFTRSLTTTYGHIDPGPEPEVEENAQNTDVEMTDRGDQDPDPDAMTDRDPDTATEKTLEDRGNGPNQDDMADYDPINNVREDRLIIAIDFGTTFSSVAYTVIPKGVSAEEVDLRSVECVGNYPGYDPPPGVLDYRQDVPTELWYDDDGGASGQLRTHVNGAYNHAQSEDNSETEESSSSEDDATEDEHPRFGNDSGLEEHATTPHKSPRTMPSTQYWGYQVQQKLNMANIPRDEARPLTRFKLLLDQKRETDDVRTDIRMILRALTKKRIIKTDTDIYTHFLTHLLKHTKEQLIVSRRLRPDMVIQFVLCVPAKWPVRGCRTMQTALEEAIIAADFTGSAGSSVQNIFMISEPEAAAECILTEARSELFVSKICSFS